MSWKIFDRDPTTEDKSPVSHIQNGDLWTNTQTGNVFICSDAGSGTWDEVSPAYNNSQNAITVDIGVGDTPEENGVALLNAYERAKSLLPNGSALTATNRAVLFIPPGKYLLTDTFLIDGLNVDLCAICPITTGFSSPSGGTPAPTGFSTLITCEGGGKATAVQTSYNTHIYGIAFENTGTTIGSTMALSDNAFVLKTASMGTVNYSVYERLYFRQLNYYHPTGLSASGRMSIVAEAGYSIFGTWIDCVGENYGWRLAHTSPVSNAPIFGGTWYRCFCGSRGFGGDIPTNSGYEPQFKAKMYECLGGVESFAGCSAAGMGIHEDAEFWHCRSLTNSFALGRPFAGKAYYCTSVAPSFGASYSLTDNLCGEIAATAELIGCTVTGNGSSFGSGGRKSKFRLGYGFGDGGMKGKLINCTAEGLTAPIILDGGMIKDCNFKCVTTNKPAVVVRDPDSYAYRSYLLGNGAGVSVDTELTESLTSSGGPVQQHIVSNDAYYTSTLYGPIKPSSVTITAGYNGGTLTITDDGSGNLIGDVDGGGTNTINYATGEIDLTFSNQPDVTWSAIVSYKLDLSSGDNRPIIAGCTMNLGLDGDVASRISSAGNVTDSAVLIP